MENKKEYTYVKYASLKVSCHWSIHYSIHYCMMVFIACIGDVKTVFPILRMNNSYCLGSLSLPNDKISCCWLVSLHFINFLIYRAVVNNSLNGGTSYYKDSKCLGVDRK